MDYSHSASRSSSTTYSGQSSSSVLKEPMSPKVAKAAHFLSELVGSYNTEQLCEACHALANTINEADRDCLHLLSERDVVGVVIKVMENLPSHLSVQQAGCELLWCCNQQVELRSSVEERNAYQSVLSSIRRYPDDIDLLRRALSALASFAETALCDTGLKESKAYSCVLNVMSRHGDDTAIQSSGLRALASLLRNDQYAVSIIARQGEHSVIMEALTNHSSNPEVVAYGFQTLQLIASNDIGIGILLELTDILVLLMKQLEVFSDNEMVVAAASGVINILTAAEVEPDLATLTDITSLDSVTSRASVQSQFSNQVVELGVLGLLTELLDRYTEVLEIQVHVFSSIEHICVLPEIEVTEELMHQWLYLLSDAFQNHGQEPAMMEAGCRCLAIMLELNPSLHNLIGPEKSQIPLHNSVWITLLGQSNEPNPAVFKAVTMAIFFLVEDDDNLQQLLLEKGVGEALLECVREYLSEETKSSVCVEYGCRALRAVLRSHYKDDYLVRIGIVRDLSRILDEFVTEPDVITEAFCVIACLADLESFHSAVLDCSLCKLLLAALDKHSSHEILVESAFEVLIMLSQNDSLVALLHDIEVLESVVAMMRNHVALPAIQCKGCLLIRLLSAAEYLHSKQLCTLVAKVVIDTISKKADFNVQTEALACLYTLCQCSLEMSEALVKGDIHLILFSLLYREPEAVSHKTSAATDISVFSHEEERDDFVFQVGTDIIYLLSCVRDFKQEMLSTAVQNGIVEGVKVLVEIGADVNHGEEGETPICVAVHAKNKMMVEFLLQNGVNNVHKALAIAREMRFHEITGLLLKHIGLDRNGDVVNLSGLELETIKPAWILPSLGGRCSDADTTQHRRNRSLGKLNELLKHRKSTNLGESVVFDTPILSMRRASVTGMESLTGTRGFKTRLGYENRKSSLTSPSPFQLKTESADQTDGTICRTSVPGIESVTGSRWFRTRYENVTRKNSRPSPSRSEPKMKNVHQTDGMRNGNQTDHRATPEQSPATRHKILSLSTLRQKLNTGFFRRRSRSSTPNSSSGDSCQSSGEHKKSSRGRWFKRSKSPERTENEFGELTELPTTPTRPKDRRRKSGLQSVTSPDALSNYEPPLSPIEGTPTHKANRMPSEGEGTVDSGVDTSRLQSQSSVFSSDVSDEVATSFRKSKSSRRGTITGVEISRLPFSNVDEYTTQKQFSLDNSTQNHPEELQKLSTINSSHLFRQLKRMRQTQQKKKKTSTFYRQLIAPSLEPVVDIQISSPEEPSKSANPAEESTLSESKDSSLPALKELDMSTSTDQSTGMTASASESSMNFSFQLSSSSNSLKVPKDEVDFAAERDEDLKPQKLIKTIDLSSNLLRSLMELCTERDSGQTLRRMSSLQKLDLKQNQLKHLPRELMQELSKLSSLNVSCNAFTVFPEAAVLSQCLTSLDLSANKITVISPLPVLPNLVRLNLSDNQLLNFPQTISPENNAALLPQLRYLNLQSNDISDIPATNAKLHNLEELNISKNRIRTLPDTFLANLSSLKILDGSRNDLSHIAGEIAQHLVYLITVKVASNNLGMYEGDFHIFITSAPVLQNMDASENGLTSLPPPYAWKSRAVRDIRLTGNKLTKLDLSDAKKFWPHLESFYLGDNKLKEIPKEIGSLPSLSCLDISHNKDIKHLPYEMGNLDHLFLLNLQGLRNLSLDPSLLNGPTKSIISYLKSRHTRSVPYYHMKLMMVGAAAKGKTTLLSQLTSEKTAQFGKAAVHSERNMATLGVSVRQWSYPYKPGGHGNTVNYHLSCWDFAGQEEFYSTHQCFLSQRSLYVLVYNLSLGESELQQLLPWLLNVQARAPSSPVIIVGTHADKLSQEEFVYQRTVMRDKIREMLRKPGFPGDVSFGEVSCFNEKLVTNLRVKIKKLIDGAKLRGQKIMGGMVPANYLALEELIQKEKRYLEQAKSKFPVLQACRLKELMDASKLSQKMDKTEIDRATQFLHECGVLLYYSDLQTKLSELYFLNPEWLCMLMAQIITIPEINPFISKEGLMFTNSLSHVLKEPRFPLGFQPEYIRLLERFEVALRQTEDTLLIPSHLIRKKPVKGISLPELLPCSRIVRRYNLCYIPPGFWPRLIARLITFPLRALPEDQQDETPPTREVWSGGMYTYWQEDSYFLIELVTGEKNVFDITVPTSHTGTRLLCSIVDNVEALIDEWFPGLRDLDIGTGYSLVRPMAVCPLCPDPPHCFPMGQLTDISLTAEEVDCPVHKEAIPLELLAPDTVISDLDPCYKVAQGEFILEEITKNFLGKGGFGEVYKAEFRGQAVAVKIFSPKVAAINSTTPNHLIRQEVQILGKCKHPYIVSMVAVTLRPKPMLFLEFAELGSLNSLYPYSNMSLTLKHRIVYQVAGALAYLHKCSVIYRDLKPDNVLIFSLSTIAKVNAKLSDYGISCYATEGGLTQNMGTAGYKAPELLMANFSSMTYNEKVDIYSYGLMLFVMMTNGHRPFEELSAGYEIDKFIMEGRPINDIDYFGCPPWPDMQDLINHCLQYTPSNRPSAQEVFDRLCSTEFVSLKRAVQVEKDQPVQMFATRCFTEQGTSTRNVEVWMASVLDKSTMISIMNLSKKNTSPQGMFLPPNNVIQSILAVEHQLVLMGTTTGQVFVYSGKDKKLRYKLACLRDSVLCLIYFWTHDRTLYVCAGLADGRLAYYDQSSLSKSNGEAQILRLGRDPVTSIKRYHACLYVSCGEEIVVLLVSDWSIVSRWSTNETRSGHIRGIEVGQDLIWTTHIKTPKIHVWDLEDGQHRGTLHCDLIVNSLLPKNQAMEAVDLRVISMHLQPHPYSVLWLGLSSGHLLVINASSRIPLMITKRHVRAIRSIQSVKAVVAEKPVHLILTAGYGFLQRPGYDAPSRGTPESYGNLLVWESIMPRLKQEYDEVKKRMASFK